MYGRGEKMTKKVKFSLFLSISAMVAIITVTMLNSGITIHNPAPNMTATILNEVKAYETEFVYNASIPSTADPLTLVEGVNGLDFTYDGLNYIHLSDMKNEVVKTDIIFTPQEKMAENLNKEELAFNNYVINKEKLEDVEVALIASEIERINYIRENDKKR